ncbi:MAG: apolipoprotein N-acyltransferase [Bacteroidota bacterium]
MRKYLGLFGLFTLAGSLIAYNMFQRFSQQELWGMRPLFLFIFIWGALSSLGAIRWGKNEGFQLRFILSSSAGLLLSIGFPDTLIPFPFFAMVGYVPLLILMEMPSLKRRQVFGHAFNTFLIWNFITTFWVANTAFLAGVFAVVVNSFLMTIPILTYFELKNKIPRLAAVSFIATWLTFEMVHYHWDLAWPWLTLGNEFAAFPSLVQWYEYTGVFGGSLWILVANWLLWKIWQKTKASSITSRHFLPILAWVFLPIGLSFFLYYTYEEEGESRQMVLIQPNYEPHYEKFALSELQQTQEIMDWCRGAIGDKTDFLVLPETVFGLIERESIRNYPAVQQLEGLLIDFPQLNIVTGVSAYEFFEPENGWDMPSTVRRQMNRNGEEVYYEILNAAIHLKKGQVEVPLYRKSKLVPGPEIFPFKEILFFMEPLVTSLGGTIAGLGTQKERSIFEGEKGKIAPIICYESVFGSYVTDYLKKGAEALVIMTNDGWWDKTPGHLQHLRYASLRAIETRKGVARAANTGVSAFINQRGDLIAQSKYGEATALKGNLMFNNKTTFYTQWGDVIPRIALLITGLLILNLFSKKRV